jgi:hypothetical protein
MAIALTETITTTAAALVRDGSVGTNPAEAVAAIVEAAGGDRRPIEAARDQLAARLHASVDDWDATASLTLLNRTLATMPRLDPLDWRVRWGQRFRRP